MNKPIDQQMQYCQIQMGKLIELFDIDPEYSKYIYDPLYFYLQEAVDLQGFCEQHFCHPLTEQDLKTFWKLYDNFYKKINKEN